jgi:hypothetical protein
MQAPTHFRTSGDPKSIAQRPKSIFMNYVSGQLRPKHGKQTKKYKSCLEDLKKDIRDYFAKT